MIYKLLLLIHLLGPHGIVHKARKPNFKDVQKSECLVYHDAFELQCDSNGVII